MPDTIPQPHRPLEDVRVEVARQLLAELPEAEDNELPYFWIGRLRTALGQLLEVAAPAPAGLDAGQRETLGQALSDALAYRAGPDHCADCLAEYGGLCYEHVADEIRCDDYLQLAAELGIEVDR